MSTVTINGKDLDLSAHMTKLKERGGDLYLKVPGRVLMFRADQPRGGIQTELVHHDRDAGFAHFKAAVLDEYGKVLATAYGSEYKAKFGDYLEKAETVAVGRALALAGYGTQFATGDFYESDDGLANGEKLADAPIKAKTETAKTEPKEATSKVKEANPQGATPPPSVLAEEARQRALLFTQIADARKAASMTKTQLQEWMIAQKYSADFDKITIPQLQAMLAHVKSLAPAA